MKGKAALIGHTGFIGSFLKSSGGYTHFYNSTNIGDIGDEQFDVVVCAGTSAVKWQANAEPERDRQGILRLQENLARLRAGQFVLVSTVDVFQTPLHVNENTPVNPEGLHPYGLHRYGLEVFVREHFQRSCVVRLPAMFGPGLKKNALYDLLHDNNIDKIPMNASFQWYNLRHLPHDLPRMADLPLVHMATEPVAMHAIVDRFFPDKSGRGHTGKAANYDMQTIYAERFGGQGSYIADAETILAELGTFVREERERLQGKG